MTFFELLTEILVPVASPLVAAIAIVIAVRAEGRKIRLEHSTQRRQRMESIFTDALYARDLFTILTYQSQLGQMEHAHVAEFQLTIDRVFDKIFSDPEIGRRFYEDVAFECQHNNIFRLLAELRIRTAKMDPNRSLDLLMYFGVTTLLYLYDSDERRRHEVYKELEKVRDAEPALYSNLIVARNTKSLKISA